MISPIHPNLWPFAFRIEAAPHNVAGTLKSLTKELAQNNVNVLFIDQSPAGYTHSVFNAVGTFDFDSQMLQLFESMENEVYQARTDSGGKGGNRGTCEIRTEGFQKLGLLMISRLAGLWARLRVAEQLMYDCRDTLPEETYFLARRVVEQGLEPGTFEYWTQTVID